MTLAFPKNIKTPTKRQSFQYIIVSFFVLCFCCAQLTKQITTQVMMKQVISKHLEFWNFLSLFCLPQYLACLIVRLLFSVHSKLFFCCSNEKIKYKPFIIANFIILLHYCLAPFQRKFYCQSFMIFMHISMNLVMLTSLHMQYM